MFINAGTADAHSDFNNSVAPDYKDRRHISVKNHQGPWKTQVVELFFLTYYQAWKYLEELWGSEEESHEIIEFQSSPSELGKPWGNKTINNYNK